MEKIEEAGYPELIEAYRNSLIERYSLDRVRKYSEFASISDDAVKTLVRYFLELLYPEYEGRRKLDAAFGALSRFVHSPAKVFSLLGSLGVAVFQFGKHLGQAFKAGFAALNSYLSARRFELLMLPRIQEKMKHGQDPRNPEVFHSVLAQVPKEEADEFREDVVRLFSTLANHELIEKIILVMRRIVSKMKDKPKTYSAEDLSGIELGLSILERGEELFCNFTPEELHLIVQAIDRIERDFFEEIQEKFKIPVQ